MFSVSVMMILNAYTSIMMAMVMNILLPVLTLHSLLTASLLFTGIHAADKHFNLFMCQSEHCLTWMQGAILIFFL